MTKDVWVGGGLHPVEDILEMAGMDGDIITINGTLASSNTEVWNGETITLEDANVSNTPE